MSFENKHEMKGCDRKLILESAQSLETRIRQLNPRQIDLLGYIGESYEGREGLAISVGDWRPPNEEYVQIDVLCEAAGYTLRQYEELEPNSSSFIPRIEEYLSQYYKKPIELLELMAVLKRCLEIMTEEIEHRRQLVEGKSGL